MNPTLPIKSAQELVDYAKANPDELDCATGGNGKAAHIAMAASADAANIEMTHVPYRRTNPAVTEVIVGHV